MLLNVSYCYGTKYGMPFHIFVILTFELYCMDAI